MMDREHIQKLLGGYATGTLTPEEQQALFEAALADQELFDALAREQSLRDLLRDPAVRAQLLASIDERPLPWYRSFWKPAAIAAAAACLLGAGVYLMRPKPQATAPAPLVALMKEPAAAPPVALPPPPPAPKHAARPAKAAKREFVPAPPLPPPAPAPAPAAPTETVEVTAAAPAVSAGLQNSLQDAGSQPIPLQNAQALFYALPALGRNGSTLLPQTRKLEPRAAHLGVKWTILRQREGGDFVEVEPGELRAGDAVKVRLIPNDDGFLSVWESGSAVVTATSVERLKPLETPVITSDVAGQKILTVQFTRTVPPQPTGIIRNAAQQQSATDSREHATYVLSVNASPVEPVSVKIALVFQ
jgi:hypothetical protein